MSLRSLLTLVFVWLASTLYARLSDEGSAAPVDGGSVAGVCDDQTGPATDCEHPGDSELPADGDPIDLPGDRIVDASAPALSSPYALRSSACRNLGHPNSISGIAELDRSRTAAAVRAVVHTIQPDTPALTAVASPIRTHAPPHSRKA